MPIFRVATQPTPTALRTTNRRRAMPALDPSKLKVVELKAELTNRGIAAKGKKAVLVKALEDALAQEQEQEQEQQEQQQQPDQAVEHELAAALAAIDSAPGAADAADATATSTTAKHDGARELNVKFGGVLSAENRATVASQRVPTREGIRPGEGSTKIPGTQRLARDSGTHEFYGAVVKPAEDPQSRKVKLNRPGITKSGRKWRPVKTKRCVNCVYSLAAGGGSARAGPVATLRPRKPIAGHPQ
jgi:hypothetical protein